MHADARVCSKRSDDVELAGLMMAGGSLLRRSSLVLRSVTDCYERGGVSVIP